MREKRKSGAGLFTSASFAPHGKYNAGLVVLHSLKVKSTIDIDKGIGKYTTAYDCGLLWRLLLTKLCDKVMFLPWSVGLSVSGITDTL